MAPHSSTLAWKIPWMEEPGGLQSMGSQRVGHDWSDLVAAAAAAALRGSGVKNLLAIQETQEITDSISGLGKTPEGGNDSPLQYSCLENSMDRGAKQAIVHRVSKSWTWLNNWACTHMHTWRYCKSLIFHMLHHIFYHPLLMRPGFRCPVLFNLLWHVPCPC